MLLALLDGSAGDSGQYLRLAVAAASADPGPRQCVGYWPNQVCLDRLGHRPGHGSNSTLLKYDQDPDGMGSSDSYPDGEGDPDAPGVVG